MKSTLIKLSLIAFGSLALFADAIAQGKEKLVLAYNAAEVDTPPVRLSTTCTLNVTSVADRRNNVENISSDHELPAGDPTPWIKSGLENLKVYGYDVRQNPTPMAGAVNLDVQLIRSYTWMGNMRINGMVAMDVGITPAGGTRTVQKFRASGSKTNMWGASSEYLTTLNYSFNNVLQKMATSLQAACSEAKTATR